MISKTKDAISRCDRVLVAAMSIVLATASAAVGASLTNNPHADQIRVIGVDKPVVRLAGARHPCAHHAVRRRVGRRVCAAAGGASLPPR